MRESDGIRVSRRRVQRTRLARSDTRGSPKGETRLCALSSSPGKSAGWEQPVPSSSGRSGNTWKFCASATDVAYAGRAAVLREESILVRYKSNNRRSH